MDDIELESDIHESPPEPLSFSEGEDLLPPRGRPRARRRRRTTVRNRVKGHRQCLVSILFRSLFWPRRSLQLLFSIVLLLLGALVCSIVTAVLETSSVDPYDSSFARFWNDRFSSSPNSYYPQEFFGNVLPIPCHSHNDYWRRTPLFAALGSGCVSVEADIWVKDSELYVGHTERNIRVNSTLQRMYINPILQILEVINTGWDPHYPTDNPMGVFYNDPMQTLTLLIDFKGSSAETWPILYGQLEPLRERGWLSYWNGTARIERPVTIVASGAVDFNSVIANKNYRDIFYDAPLDGLRDPQDDPSVPGALGYKYNPSNSHLASSRLDRAVGPLFASRLTSKQMEMVRSQTQDARARHLTPRYWGTPRWPRALRNSIWDVLVHEGVWLLNVDDLRAARKGQWGIWPQGDLDAAR